MANFRKNETEQDRLGRINGPRVLPTIIPNSGKRIDTDDEMYVEAVAQAREFGRLYEGINMAEAVAKAKAERRAGFFN